MVLDFVNKYLVSTHLLTGGKNYCTDIIKSDRDLNFSPFRPLWKLLHFTFITEIIHHDNLMQKLFGGHLNDTMHCPHQSGPALVVEDQYDTGRGKIFWILPVLTPIG